MVWACRKTKAEISEDLTSRKSKGPSRESFDQKLASERQVIDDGCREPARARTANAFRTDSECAANGESSRVGCRTREQRRAFEDDPETAGVFLDRLFGVGLFAVCSLINFSTSRSSRSMTDSSSSCQPLPEIAKQPQFRLSSSHLHSRSPPGMLQMARGAEPAGCLAIVCLRRGVRKTPSSIRLLLDWLHCQLREDHPDYADFNQRTALAVRRQTGRLRKPVPNNRHDRGVGTMATWTKPQGGIHVWRESGLPAPPLPTALPLRKHGKAACSKFHFVKELSHDTRSATNDRGYAGAESVAAHASLLRTTGLALCPLLRQITGSVGHRRRFGLTRST